LSNLMGANEIFLRTVIWRKRLKSWNTIPIFVLRIFREVYLMHRLPKSRKPLYLFLHWERKIYPFFRCSQSEGTFENALFFILTSLCMWWTYSNKRRKLLAIWHSLFLNN
jgi:hypothetical protein